MKSTGRARMTRPPVARVDDAVCLDGSPAAFYWRRGSGAGANKWYIHHQGGGWCTGPEGCGLRAGTNLGGR
jgi:hypothetical protein